MSVHLLGIPQPIYLIGESHTIIYRNLLFRSQRSDQLFQCRTQFLPKILASAFFMPETGNFHPDFIEAMRVEGLLKANLEPAHSVMDAATISGSWMERRPVLQPAVVAFAGDIELNHLLRQIAGYDFELPDDPGYGVDRSLKPVPLQSLLLELNRILGPLVKGASYMRRQDSRNSCCIPCLRAASTTPGMLPGCPPARPCEPSSPCWPTVF